MSAPEPEPMDVEQAPEIDLPELQPVIEFIADFNPFAPPVARTPQDAAVEDLARLAAAMLFYDADDIYFRVFAERE